MKTMNNRLFFDILSIVGGYMKIVKGYNIPKFNCSIINVDKIRDILDELKIAKIIIGGCLIFQDKEVLMCDIDNPVMFVNNLFYNRSVCIDGSYYNLHTEEIQKMVVYICSNTKENKINISDSILITGEVIDAILSNHNLKEVSLGNKDDVFVLTEDLYKRFKESSITSVMTYGVVDSLNDNFEPLIRYNYERKLIGSDNYERLQKYDKMFIYTPLRDEEIDNLKYLNKNAEVNFSSSDYDNFFRCLNRLRECGHTGLISIKVEKKNGLNDYIFSHLDMIKNTDNVEVKLLSDDYSLSTYIKYEKKLIDLILPAINLSPFEKYLFAYNVVKKFKKYNENEEDKSSARNLYRIFDNEYMVCVAYSKLLGDLLDKLGIENYEDSVKVDVGLDGISNEVKTLPDFMYDEKTGELREIQTESVGHARRKVHLVDHKYGIDGYYYADPTWDNDMEHDAYCYALMTAGEYIGLDRYNYYELYDLSELFFISSLEEFYFKINIYLDKNRKKTEKDVIKSLLVVFKKLDSEFYTYLLDKYQGIDNYSKKFTKDEIQDILFDIGDGIIKKSNKIVDGQKFKEGITTLYRDIEGLGAEELDIKVSEIIEYNRKRYEKCFPTRYKIDKYGNQMTILNAVNKFDLDNKQELKY